MKINNEVLKLLNEQVYNELYAAHLYFAISAKLKKTTYQGMASWMMLQAKEEMHHAMKFYDFILYSNGTFEPNAIPKPDVSAIQKPLDAYKASLAHEEKVTAQITKIFEVSNNVKDWLTADLANEFLKEQREEEHTAYEFVKALEFAGDDKNLLMGIDKWASKRED